MRRFLLSGSAAAVARAAFAAAKGNTAAMNALKFFTHEINRWRVDLVPKGDVGVENVPVFVKPHSRTEMANWIDHGPWPSKAGWFPE